MSKIFIKLRLELLLLIFSIFALLFAYSWQYFMQDSPCILCMYQRIIYIAIVFLSGAMVISKKICNKYTKFVLMIFVLAETCVAVYHVGIEHNIFKPTAKCMVLSDDENLDLEQLRQSILNEKPKRNACGTPVILFQGISVAEANMIYALLLLLLSIYRMKKNETSR